LAPSSSIGRDPNPEKLAAIEKFGEKYGPDRVKEYYPARIQPWKSHSADLERGL
jgi:hypothetical protein